MHKAQFVLFPTKAICQLGFSVMCRKSAVNNILDSCAGLPDIDDEPSGYLQATAK